jgi:hypothetical protein
MRQTVMVVLLLCAFSPSGRAADINLGPAVLVAPGGSIPLPIMLANVAPPGGVTVTLTSSDTSKVSLSPENVYIPGGLQSPYGLPRVLGIGFGTATISATAFGLVGSSQTVQVAATLAGPPNQSIQRGSSINVMFALPWPAPAAVTLNVRSDNPAIAGVPASVTIPASGTTAVVPVSGLSVGATTVHISSLPDISDATVGINVFTAGTITLSPTSLTLGQSLPFPIALAAPAPGSGVFVLLSSSNPSTVPTVPSSVFIPGGQTTPLTQPEIAGENIGVATITASAPGYADASQAVPVMASITMSPQTLRIPVGGAQLLSMILSAAAPSIGVPITPDRAAGGYVNGLTVSLSSSDSRIASVQPSVQFYPDGSSITTVVVLVSGQATGTATIHAGAPPFIPDVTATVIVGAPTTGPASLTATGGTPQTAQVNTPFGLSLSVTARDAGFNPVSGVLVSFAAPGSGPGASFAGGISTALTDASGVARSQTLTANVLPGTYQVTASAAGVSTPAVFTLTNMAATSGAIMLPAGVTVGPNQSQPFPVTLTVPSPAGGIIVNLVSSDPAKAIISPASVTIPGGSITPPAQPIVTGVNFGSATMGASALGLASASQLVQVGAALSFSPASLAIGAPGTQNFSLNLSSTAPASGLTVSLVSSNPGVATVSPSIFFPPATNAVSVPVNGIAAGSATIAAAAPIPNLVPANGSVNVSSSSNISLAAGVKLAPGESAALPVFLAGPARPGGVTLTLSSSDPSKLTCSPSNVYIAEGLTAPLSTPRVTGVNFGTASVTASAYGLTGATQTVQVVGNLSGPQGQTLQPGAAANLMFALSWPTPTAITFAVSSDNPAVAKVPASVTIPPNGTTAVVPVSAVAGGITVIRISALPDILPAASTITVLAPATFTVSNGLSMALGQSASFSVLSGTPAPSGGLVVTLSSSDTGTVSISPNSIFIPAGATTSSTIPVVTGHNIGAATITASAPGYLNASGSVSVTATLTLSPSTMVIPVGGAKILAMALSSAAPSAGPITPDRAAGGFVEGLTVKLTSSNPYVASVQPTVQFYPDGSSVTTVVVVVSGLSPGTSVIHASALPFVPDVSATVIVQ